MSKIKEFIKTHKKMSIITCVVVVLLIAAIVVSLVLIGHNDRKDKDSDKKTSFKDWDNLIADLEEEPISDLDEKYKENSDSTDKSYKISINKTQNYIVIYEKDKNNKYTKAVKSMICSTGFDTPVGTFTTSDKYTWKIVNGNVWTQYATRVQGNVLIHSMPYSDKDKATLIPDYYNQLGRTLSTGSIRVSAGDAQWIIKNCKKGTVVDIYESEDRLEDMPVAIKVPDDAGWDPTDPDSANPWKSVELGFEGLENVINVERGTQFDYMQGVSVKDTCGNDISSQVKVTTEMDIFKPGVYIAKYEVSDAAGKTAEREVTFQVQDTIAPKLCGLNDTMYFTTIAAVTKESILDGVKVLDNNQVMDSSIVQVNIPPLVEGVNQVTVTAADEYQNVMTTTINIVIDSNPPVVALKAGMAKTIPLTQVVDRSYAISRIDATDDGKPVEDSQISVNIVPKLWGYKIYYEVSDKQGNTTSFQDEVDYVEYTISVSGKLNVTDITNKEQLLEGVVVKAADGSVVGNNNIKYTVNELAGNKYEITYSYSYSSALGTKTVTAKDSFTIKSVATPVPTSTPASAPTAEPVKSEAPTVEPQISSIPPEDTQVP